MPLVAHLFQHVSFISVSWWLVAILCLLYNFWRMSRPVRLLKLIPGPKGVPILGNLFNLMAVDKTEFLKLTHVKWRQQFGPIYCGWIFNAPVVAISSPELMEPILASATQIDKGQEYSYLADWLGDGMFLTTGQRWKDRRRLLTPAFHFQILEGYVHIFNEHSRILADKFHQYSLQQSANGTDVYTDVMRCSLNAICETSMGKRTEAEDENSNYISNVNKKFKMVMERGVRPWLRNEFVFQKSSLGRKTRDCVRTLHEFTNKVVAERKQTIEVEGFPDEHDNGYQSRKRLAFLDVLIKASDQGRLLTDVEIRQEVDTSMMAGFDTTGTAICWFLHCMATNPEQQRLLHDELDLVFGGSDRPCEPRDLADLKYLECCIKETLRMYPSIPAIMRTLTRDTLIGGYTVPAGTSVSLMIYGMHHDEKIYPQPERFNPERFFADNSRGRHPYAYIPFSAGPRNCIGQKYAIMEMKVILSTIMRRFSFTRPTESDFTVPSSEIILKPCNGVTVNIQRRS